MSVLDILRLRLRAIFRRDDLERELDDELRFHLEMQTEENLRAGMDPAEARRRAVLLFGGVEGHREASRKAKGVELMGARASWLDFKLGLRMLVKYPGLTLVGGLALVVATGMGAAFFQFTQNMFNPRIPFEDGDRIVAIQNWDLAAARPEPRSLSDFLGWREELRSVADLGVHQGVEQTVTTEDGYTETMEVARISASAFRITGVAPLLGRPLLPDDEGPGAAPVVLIDGTAWERLFGRDPDVVGRTLRLGATEVTVVGVMPADYGFPVNHSVWTPFRVDGLEHGPREGPPVRVFGRLRPGATLEEAQAELAALGARASADSPATHAQLRPGVMRFADALVMNPEMRWAIQGVRFLFLLLMLVMCVNVATLVFARTATREGEFAVRSALGASRRRIVLQLFLEALALTLVAAVVGLAAAWWGLRWGMDLFWRVQEEPSAPFWWDNDLSAGTILYALVLATVGAGMVGIVPALKVTGRRVQPTLSQVALSVAFLPTAIMEGRTALRDAQTSSGFPADAYLAGPLRRELEVPPEELPEGERAEVLARTADLFEEVRRRVEAEPGVSAVAFASRVPGMNHGYETIHMDAPGAATPSDTSAGPIARPLSVDAGFFEAMRASLVLGRALGPGDAASGGSVLVNEPFVRTVMNGQNPVGHRIRYPRREAAEGEPWYEVVGVVRDLEMDAFGPGPHEAIYHPLTPGQGSAVQMFVRVGSHAQTLAPRLRATITSIDPTLRLGELLTVREIWAPYHRSARFFAAMQAVVALVALLLSMAGIHALMSFTVARRTREIGIRAALGARPGRIVAAIFSRSFAQLGLGVLIGSAVAAGVRRDQLATEGPFMLLAIVATMLTVGLLACFLPARRALRIQPTEALKSGG